MKKNIRILKKYIRHPFAGLIRLIIWFPDLIKSDKFFIACRYYLSFYKWPNLRNPQTFNEKLQWLKLYDRKDEYINLVDKYEAKKIVSDIIGQKHVIPTLGIYDDVEDIDFEALPNKFVLKCTHDSGGIVICKDKRKLNVEEAKDKLRKGLKTNYFWQTREWPYKNVRRRIIAEEYLEDATGELKDYKFMCFGGKVKCLFTVHNRYGNEGLFIDFFDKSWNVLPFSRHYPNSRKEDLVTKPLSFNLMIEMAEKLSSGICFVRVDFYEVSGIPYFGEMTFYPGSGYEEFTPSSWDTELGRWITLPKFIQTKQ